MPLLVPPAAPPRLENKGIPVKLGVLSDAEGKKTYIQPRTKTGRSERCDGTKARREEQSQGRLLSSGRRKLRDRLLRLDGVER